MKQHVKVEKQKFETAIKKLLAAKPIKNADLKVGKRKPKQASR